MGAAHSLKYRRGMPSARDVEVRKVSNTPQHEFLTNEEKAKAIDTWTDLDYNHTARGIRVFLRIFEKMPETKQLFPFRDLPNESLHKDVLFKGHATRFMKAVAFTMQNIDALDVIVIPTLVQIGGKHINMKGFKPEYLDLFSSAMMDIWQEDLGQKFRNETRTAWIKIFHLITSKVYDGYNDAKKEMNGDTLPNLRAGENGNVSDIDKSYGTQEVHPPRL